MLETIIIYKVQQFSTWGTRTHRGMQAVLRGYAEFKILSKKPQKVNKRFFWGTPKESILVWGYVKGAQY
jgi:hypothetical protein